MKTLVNALAVLMLGIAGLFALAFSPLVYAITTTTTSTFSVVGWLVPDGTHWGNGIVALVFPLVGASLFGVMGKLLDMQENQATFALVGLFIGGLLGMLSLGNASGAGQAIPFALPVVAAVDLILWLWRGKD